MQAASPKRLSDFHNEFERGVFLSVYNARPQRLRRLTALGLLGIKHGLRGVLFSWPLYLLPLAAWQLQGAYLPVIGLLLLPGLWVSWVILRRGVIADYARYVDGHILQPGYPARLLFPASYRR